MADPQSERLTVVTETKIRRNSSGDFVSGKVDHNEEYAYGTKTEGRSYGKLFLVAVLAVALLGGLIATIIIYESQPARRVYGWWHSTTIYQVRIYQYLDSPGPMYISWEILTSNKTL